MSSASASDIVSESLEMSAAMPQGSYFRPLAFIIFIDSLRLACMTHKFVDDTTVTELLNKLDISCIFMHILMNLSSSLLLRHECQRPKDKGNAYWRSNVEESPSAHYAQWCSNR